MNKQILLSTLGALFFVTSVSALAIFFARGYTFNPKSGKIEKTGILVITSEPKDAGVYLDGKLKSTTNTTINFVAPGKYKVRVTKDGFTTWQKEVEVKPELVTRLDVMLFPQVPDLRRLTFTGVSSVSVTPDGSRAIYTVTEKTKRGIWAVPLTSNTLPFFGNGDPFQLYDQTEDPNLVPAKPNKNLSQLDVEKTTILMSPDSRTALLTDTSLATPRYYLLDLTKPNDTLVPQTELTIRTTLAQWLESASAKEVDLRQKLVRSVRDIPWYENPKADIAPILASIDQTLGQAAVATSSATPEAASQTARRPQAISRTPEPTFPTISTSVSELASKIAYIHAHSRWSLKQDKVLFTVANETKVYDLATGKTYKLPQADSISWLPTNMNVIMINPEGKKGEIAVADYDGQNKVTVFSGNFVDSIAIPWINGTRIVVLTNLNQAAGTDPNLYAINLR